MVTRKINIIVLFLLVACSTCFAQNISRTYIRNSIKEWGSCRNVAITQHCGDVALYGKNGWSCSGVPKDLKEAIEKLNAEKEYIDDVQITESGKWIILYGDNGIQYNDIPASLVNKLKEYNERQEVITSVSLNDRGEWIIITTNYFCCSDDSMTKWIEEGRKQHGKIWATCLTNDAIAVVYENGYRFNGNIPEALKKALKETKVNVYRLKIAGNSWFFADQKGTYRYFL